MRSTYSYLSNRYSWTFISFVLLFFYSNAAHTQELGIPFNKFIGSEVYKAGMQNNAMAQDQRGFLYFANNFGLLEFDGSLWKTYPVKDGSKLRDIAISQEGKIYVAAQGDYGYFIPNISGDLAYHSLSAQLPDQYLTFDEVWNVFLGKKETYFCTSNQIFVYEDDSLINVIETPATTNFYFINNRLYLQSDLNELYVYINENLTSLISSKQLQQNTVVAIMSTQENDLMIVCESGQLFDQYGIPVRLTKEQEIALKGNSINSAIRLNNGDIAYGTQSNGLFIFRENGSLLYHLTKGRGLNHRVINTMLEDLQGNLWLGHNNGISIVELSIPFTYINEELGLPGTGYDAYAKNADIYLATNNGLFKTDIKQSDSRLKFIANTDGQNYSLKEISNKLLLGHHKGAFEIVGNTAYPLFDETGTWVFRKSVLGDKIIAGTYVGLATYSIKNNILTFDKKLPGFEESSRVMEFDSNGDIWMTHGYKGVYRIALSDELDSIANVQYYDESNGLPSKVLVNVFKVGNELLFTTTDGLYQFNYAEDRFQKEVLLTTETGIRGAIDILASDAQGNIYFIGQNKVGVLKKASDGSYAMITEKFNKVYPFLNDDLLNISILNSNNILFGAKEGFIVYNPERLSVPHSNFKAYIRDVKTLSTTDSSLFAGNYWDGETVLQNQRNSEIPVLEFSRNSIQFRFTANFMNDFNQTVFQYKLDGFDEDWSPWQSENMQNFTNLNEGKYIFRVRAKNLYNEISEESYYQFVILPPWYRSKLAYVGYAFLLLSSFTIFFVFIDRKYSKSQKSFEIEKQMEVDRIDSELKTLTQETTEEIDKLKSEKLQTEIDYKNAELATSTMNLINKNKFIGHIKSNLTSISKKSKSNEVIKELERISKEIDKNISHDDDWKQFALHFNKVHGDFTTRLTSEFENLSGQDLRLCSYLRLNLSTKEIAELLNISVRGVEISRYRLRKKLNLERSVNLSEFILNY
jgi:ligand-binding sensor domain-containing protein/DNA-binding CsgD family transcriptional regulator